jgi:hypothetical protein
MKQITNMKASNTTMNRNFLATISAVSILLGTSSVSLGQVAGSRQIGVAMAELREITTGWSVKRQILGQTIYNDKNENIGKVDDVIVAPGH